MVTGDLREGCPSFRICGTFFMWLGLNVGFNYYNRIVLSRAHFYQPLLFSLGNKAVGSLLIFIITLIFRGTRIFTELWPHMKRPLVHVNGVFTALNVGLNNWSLMMITLTLNQVIKSTSPLPTAVLSMIIDGKRFEWQMWASMAVLVVGCVLAAMGDSSGEDFWLGALIGGISVLCGAAWSIFAAQLMQQSSEGADGGKLSPLDAIGLILVSSPASVVTLGAFFAYMELPHLLNQENETDREVLPTEQIALYIGTAAVIACIYDIVHNEFIRITSAVNLAVMGNLKLILLVTISMATLEQAPTPLRIVGVCVSILAVGWYSFYKVQETKKALQQKAEDAEKGTGSGGTPAEVTAGAGAVAESKSATKPSESSQLLRYA